MRLWGKEHQSCIVQIYTINRRWNSVVFNKSPYSLLYVDIITWDLTLPLHQWLFNISMHTLASNFPEEFHIHAVTHILGQKNTKAHQSTTIHIVAELLLYGSAVYILFFQCKGQRISCVLLKCNMRFRECTLLISVFKEWQLKKIWFNLWSSAGIVMMNLINIQYLKYTAESMKKK